MTTWSDLQKWDGDKFDHLIDVLVAIRHKTFPVDGLALVRRPPRIDGRTWPTAPLFCWPISVR